MLRAALTVAALSLLLPTPVAADGGQYRIRWTFGSSSNGYTTTYEPMANESVVMPIGSPWSCRKLALANNTHGGQFGGFYCTSGRADVIIGVECARAKPDVRHAYSGLGSISADATETTFFEVNCSTVLVSGGGI